MQLDTLWQFMQVDMEADRFEEKMRQSPARQKLLSQRDFLKTQQTSMKKLENDVSVMQDRLAAIQDEAQRLNTAIAAFAADLKDNPPKDAEEGNARMEPLQKLMDDLNRYESELQKIRKDAEAKDRQQKEIRIRAAKTKMEYDALKQEYDVEREADSKKLAQLHAKVEAEAKKINPQLMEKYKTIKQHCTPPMAKLIEGQCTGCFMGLPSATLLQIKSGEKIVTCDNCGRILYYAD